MLLCCERLWLGISKRQSKLIEPGYNRAIYTRRVRRQYGICWLNKKLSLVHDTLHIFFRNKSFLFVKIESWNFQHLFDLGFHETLQNFSSFRQHFFMGNKNSPNKLKFCEVSRNPKSNRCWKFQFSILTNFILKKIPSFPSLYYLPLVWAV